MRNETAKNINILGNFCGKRDIKELTCKELESTYEITQADVMVLFGGSILCGGDILGQAIKDNIAKTYIIVGGEGHTTESLRESIHQEYPMIITKGLPEATIFNKYINFKYGQSADYLECNSTNCGNNITFLLELLKQNHILYNHIILSQDATMQHRMEAGLRKYLSEKDCTIINYATYFAKVVTRNSKLVYNTQIHGMWDMKRYIDLLMGEIPRLSDSGYGPKGKGYIAHVDIPQEVIVAFEELKIEYEPIIREANPSYASNRNEI